MRPPNALTTRSAVPCHEPPDRTARRIAAVSGSGHVPATLGSSATERDIAPPGSLSTTVTTGLTSAQIPLSYGSIASVYESAAGLHGLYPARDRGANTPVSSGCHRGARHVNFCDLFTRKSAGCPQGRARCH